MINPNAFSYDNPYIDLEPQYGYKLEGDNTFTSAYTYLRQKLTTKALFEYIEIFNYHNHTHGVSSAEASTALRNLNDTLLYLTNPFHKAKVSHLRVYDFKNHPLLGTLKVKPRVDLLGQLIKYTKHETDLVNQVIQTLVNHIHVEVDATHLALARENNVKSVIDAIEAAIQNNAQRAMALASEKLAFKSKFKAFQSLKTNQEQHLFLAYDHLMNNRIEHALTIISTFAPEVLQQPVVYELKHEDPTQNTHQSLLDAIKNKKSTLSSSAAGQALLNFLPKDAPIVNPLPAAQPSSASHIIFRTKIKIQIDRTEDALSPDVVFERQGERLVPIKLDMLTSVTPKICYFIKNKKTAEAIALIQQSTAEACSAFIDYYAVREIAANGMTEVTKHWFSPLVCAIAFKADTSIVEALVNKNSDLLNQKFPGEDSQGASVELSYIDILANNPSHLEMLQTILEINQRASVQYFDATAISSGLIFAVRSGNIASIPLLMQYGANIHYTNPRGFSAHEVARILKKNDIIWSMNYWDKELKSAKSKEQASAESIRLKTDNEAYVANICACLQENQREQALALIRNTPANFDLNIDGLLKDGTKVQPLYLAIAQHDQPSVEALVSKNVNLNTIFTQLSFAGNNAKRVQSVSPLIVALISKAPIALIQYLLEQKAQRSIQGQAYSLIAQAIHLEHGIDVVKLLIKHGENIFDRKVEGKENAYEIACYMAQEMDPPNPIYKQCFDALISTGEIEGPPKKIVRFTHDQDESKNNNDQHKKRKIAND